MQDCSFDGVLMMMRLHAQAAVVREHEARQLVERGLAEARAAAAPTSAVAELDIQVPEQHYEGCCS